MKRKTKLTLGVFALGLTAIGLTSCTASFCSVADKSQVMYAYDVYNIKDADGKATGVKSFGISAYYNEEVANSTKLEGYDNIYVVYDVKANKALEKAFEGFQSQGKRVPSDHYQDFWAYVDNAFLDQALEAGLKENPIEGLTHEQAIAKAKEKMTAENIQTLLIGNQNREKPVKGYGYLKYDGNGGINDYFYNWNLVYQQFLNEPEYGRDFAPSTDFVKFYQDNLVRTVAQYNSCLASGDGFYGSYGYDDDNKIEVFMGEKTWKEAWGKGFFEGLLVYPIGWLIDATTNAFMGAGAGVAQVLAIIVITFLIRAIMMAFTINQTAQTQKMSEIQPEILKIQQKYPNANTNRSEQQNLAMETQALYKKYKIHPFMSILVMILQFPIFICVWGAMTGSSVLATDSFLGLKLSASVQQTLFAGYGHPGWWTAMVVFILMAGFQVVAMLLPQFIQKKKLKKLAKTGRNPAMNKQNNTMKWVSIIMTVMVVFMGFSLASGMVIYWIAGSVWTICQTLIVELITYLKAKNKGKPHNRKPKHKLATAGADGNTVIDAEVIPDAFAAPTGKKKFKNQGSKK